MTTACPCDSTDDDVMSTDSTDYVSMSMW